MGHHGVRNDNLGGTCELWKPISRGAKSLGEWRDKKPVAPLSEYEAYQQTIEARGRKLFQPAKARRIVILMRQGETLCSAGRLIGYRMNKSTYDKMPEHLK